MAASIVLPGPGGGRSSTVTNVVVGRGATLVYEPEPVIAVAGLADLMSFLAHHPEFAAHQAAVAAYRERYGVDA